MHILTGSPHPGGTTETLASLLAQQARQQGHHPHVISLREQRITPCTNCGFCNTHPGSCMLDAQDNAGPLLDTLKQETHPLFLLPVYFYGPPALFKAFVDRAQRYWALPPSSAPQKPAYAVFCAARTQGDRLFEGNLLILRCFLRALGFYLEPPLLLRGLETPQSLALNPSLTEQLHQFGETWCRQFSAPRPSAHALCPDTSQTNQHPTR